MKKDNSKASQGEATRAVLNTNRNLWKRLSYPAYVGLDVYSGGGGRGRKRRARIVGNSQSILPCR